MKLIVLLSLFIVNLIYAQDYILSVGKLPIYTETKDKGILIDVLKELDKHYKNGHFKIEVFPFGRSIDNVKTGKADFHFPTIGKNIWGKENDVYEKELNKQGLMRSTCSLVKTPFALYINKNHPIDIQNLQKYRVETDISHTIFFFKSIKPSTCLECSIKKLSAGRIDAFIFASREIDTIIKKLKIKNIKRLKYKIFGSKFILPYNEKGKKIDKILCKNIKKMIYDGSLKKVAKPYSDYFEKIYGDPYIPTQKDINEHNKNIR
jgi:hypothetical protein